MQGGIKFSQSNYVTHTGKNQISWIKFVIATGTESFALSVTLQYYVALP